MKERKRERNKNWCKYKIRKKYYHFYGWTIKNYGNLKDIDSDDNISDIIIIITEYVVQYKQSNYRKEVNNNVKLSTESNMCVCFVYTVCDCVIRNNELISVSNVIGKYIHPNKNTRIYLCTCWQTNEHEQMVELMGLRNHIASIEIKNKTKQSRFVHTLALPP